MKTIKVLLVEDDPIWCCCLSDYISKEQDLLLIGSAKTKEHAIEFVKTVDIDVVLMDIMLTEGYLDGLDAALEISTMKKTKIIMLTAIDKEETILDAFSAGAVNYITKSNYKDIPAAIRLAYKNCSPIHTDAAHALRQELVRLKKEENQKILTSTEKQILKLVCQGFTQSRIKSLLHIAESTVKKHVNSYLKKLKAKSSKEAVEKAKKKGIL